MKKLSVLLVALLSVTLVVEDAHANRMGGGKSFGRTQQTAPATAHPRPAPADAGQALPAPPAQAPRAWAAASRTVSRWMSTMSSTSGA